MAPLKVVALISGGKDSLFSILHCISNGHDVVALANLHPPLPQPSPSEETPNDELEDIDSYMYQTVGHAVLPLYEEALGLPLYRQQIVGGAIDTAKTYSHLKSSNASSDDETESLVPLLRRVMRAHPEVNAVCSGAILSDYQRTRVETIAIRLGLVPLAYLWQFPYLPPHTRRSLLDDMSSVGQDARIIKVASGGLNERHLWLNIADPSSIDRLVNDMSRCGELENGSILGEGGEFETLAIDGPLPLWKKRIAIDRGDMSEAHSSGGVATLRVRNATLLEKDIRNDEEPKLRQPDLLEDFFKDILEQLKALPSSPHLDLNSASQNKRPPAHEQLKSTWIECGDIVALSNLSIPSVSPSEDMEAITTAIRAELENRKMSTTQILHTTILLRSMDDFATANAAYAQLFEQPNPPSRVTVACGDMLPNDISISVSLIASKIVHQSRQALHVQSQSYWAPANIGPYSQAQSWHGNDASTEKLTFFAGQIPLVPATMEVHPGDFAYQTILASQHLWRIARVMNVQCFAYGIAYIVAERREEARDRSKIAYAAWNCAHRSLHEEDEGENEDDDSFDVGDAALRSPWAATKYSGSHSESKKLKTSIPQLPNRSFLSNDSDEVSPCFAIQVSELPRKAAIEWSSLGITTLKRIRLYWDDEDIMTFRVDLGALNLIIVPVRTGGDMEHVLTATLQSSHKSNTFCEIYSTQPVPEHISNILKPKITPCHSIWNDGTELRALAILYQFKS